MLATVVALCNTAGLITPPLVKEVKRWRNYVDVVVVGAVDAVAAGTTPGRAGVVCAVAAAAAGANVKLC